MTASHSAITHLLYLHGFRSSPQSTKARQMQAWVRAHRPDIHWWCPQLAPSPGEALRTMLDGVAHWPHERMAVIGSSLGGFYATIVAERTGCRAVLLNPAVEPARDLAAYIGEITSWHGDERFFFRPEFVDALREMRPAEVTRPERYLAIIAKGDEVLDWREMATRYAGCRIKLLEGGDHALADFADAHLADVVDFLGLRPTSTPS
ncbi:YqiA/YcfP family alpha/beta fold hydrolase [Piscinibacter sp. XHJ-5]|uniref:YqiA/YcfP family alpha/beta fold hydrolase n=1 Tax=Piscinibacter sp. XHJ-5 TaxID=3037797 RepID=UPI002452E87D|nr:YqiA/YcfP family alpha/beta fold hydrolase [Piscinibacter sp. XHJ-5]